MNKSMIQLLLSMYMYSNCPGIVISEVKILFYCARFLTSPPSLKIFTTIKKVNSCNIANIKIPRLFPFTYPAINLGLQIC